MAAGWHVYAAASEQDSRGPFTPMTFALSLPSGIEPEGDWLLPEPAVQFGPRGWQQVYEREAICERRLNLTDAQPPGTLELVCTVVARASRR
jgi:hypothetical protein